MSYSKQIEKLKIEYNREKDKMPTIAKYKLLDKLITIRNSIKEQTIEVELLPALNETIKILQYQLKLDKLNQ